MGDDIPVVPVTHGPKYHFFGYYDKFPWNASGRYMLGLETNFMDRPPKPDDVAVIGLIDTRDGHAWKRIAETTAWNWQQGTMLQWLASSPEDTIIYNSRERGKYISVIHNIATGKKRTLPLPIYAISPDARKAVTLNFSRLHNHRPGYGYVGIEDPNSAVDAPENDGIYLMDIESGNHKLIVSIRSIVDFRHERSMDTPPERHNHTQFKTVEGYSGPSLRPCSHWFNHLQFNTDRARFVFMHRWWSPDGSRNDRILTASAAGSDVHLVVGDKVVSHFDWRDERHLLVWARKYGVGDYFFLFKDRSDDYEIVGKDILVQDVHCSYSPDRRWILCDSDPSGRRQFLFRVADGARFHVGWFPAAPALKAEIRCDLHPRWNRDGTKVCFDSVHEGVRQMYVADVSSIVKGQKAALI